MISIIGNGNNGVRITYDNYGVNLNEKQLSDKDITADALLEGFNKDNWSYTLKHYPDNSFYKLIIKDKYYFYLFPYFPEEETIETSISELKKIVLDIQQKTGDNNITFGAEVDDINTALDDEINNASKLTSFWSVCKSLFRLYRLKNRINNLSRY